MKVTEKKTKFTKRDFDQISEYVCDTHSTRKRERSDLEKKWDEIDRQIEMEPDISHKLNSKGKLDPDKAWMPETELPLQAQTLEILTSDARRMFFPKTGAWFSPHAELTDEYLERIDFKGLIAGDENDVPSTITQDNADKLVLGASLFWQGQYDFRGNIDAINAEAFKYGMGIGRGRLVNKNVYMATEKGLINKKLKIPVLVPRSIKNTYPDTSKHNLMNEGFIVGPSTVYEKTQKLEDLVLAAKKGSSDPKSDTGGWMTKNISRLKPNKQGEVNLLEMEGDLVFHRKTSESIFSPKTIVTIASGEGTREVVRIRFIEHYSYIEFPYHVEHVDSVYPSSPLLKGRPIQKTAVEALNLMIMSGQINVLPPVQWDKDDPDLMKAGGPNVFPGALWGSAGKVDPKQIGNPVAMMNIYLNLLQQYANVTGVNAPRLGAQTVSHTTAFAKNAEIERGTIRTVDYVNSSLDGPLERWLALEYKMGRDNLPQTDVYIPPYGGFVKISKDVLPKNVVFEAHGSGGPAEENAKSQKRLQALQLSMQIDQVAKQQGINTGFDLNKALEFVLREGGWTDVDALFGEPEQPGVSPQIPGLLAAEPETFQ